MKYLIDGYNYLFHTAEDQGPFRIEREKIIEDLARCAEIIPLSLILVFDGQGGERENLRTHFQSLEIVYTVAGETADDYILEVIGHQKNPRDYVVVTSDKRLAREAKSLGAQIKSIPLFASFVLKKRLKHQNRKREGVKEVPSLPEKEIERWQNIFQKRLE